MAIELEGLEFQISAESEKGVKQLDNLANSLEKLRNSTQGLRGLNTVKDKLEKLNSALDGFHTDKLEAMAKSLSALNNVGNIHISPTIPKRISEIAEASSQLKDEDVARLESMGNALQNLSAAGNVHIPKLHNPNVGNELNNQVPNAGGATVTPDTSGIEEATSEVQQYSNATDQATGRTNILKSVLSGIGGVFRKGFSVGTGALKQLSGALDKAAGAAKRMVKQAALLPVTLGSKLAASVKQTTSSLGGLLSSFKRIAMYRAVRAAIAALTQGFKEGINNLYQYSTIMGTQFAQSMNQLSSSALYLKNSLGAMASPIINAIAPAIDFVIDKIVTLFNIINQLFARLTGKSTYTAAKKVEAAYGEAADKVGGAAKKALKSFTIGIDELNIIEDKMNTENGGSGGGGGSDYGSMFEELPIDDSISDFADKLREAFDNAGWKQLGTLLGEKVNEIIDSIDWSGLGHKIGYGINAAVQTAYWFLDTVDFTNIGKHLAELFNGALEEIDFEYVGRLLMKGVTILPDIIIGFLSELDWGLVARSLSDFIIGVFDEATKWLRSYDWKELGSLLYNKLKDAITNIDFAGIAKSFFTFLGTALRSAIQFLGGFFGSLGADIKKWWDEEIKGQDWKETAWNLLSAIGKGFANIGNWVMENIVDPFCNALLGEDVWSGIKDAGKDIIEGLFQGIKDFFSDPLGWLKEHIVDPFIEGFKKLFGISSPSTVMEEQGRYIAEGILNGILAPFKAIGEWIKIHIFDPLVEAFKDSPVLEFAVNVINDAKTWWGNVKSWWSEKVGAVESFVTNVKNDASGWWDSVTRWWSGKVGSVKEFTTNVVNNAGTWWANVKSWWSGKVGAVESFTTGVVNQATTWWSNVKSWWGQQVGAVKDFTTNVTNQSSQWWNNVKTWWSGKVGAVQNFTTNVVNQSSQWWQSVQTWWNGKVGAVKNFTTNVENQSSTWWSNVQTWWSGKVGAVKAFTTSVVDQSATWWSNVKTWWSGKVGAVQQFTTSVRNDSTTWWNNVKTWWSGKVGAVQQFTTSVRNDATTWWSNTKRWWSGVVGAVQNFTTNVRNDSSTWWSNVKSWWSQKVGSLSVGVSIVNAASTWWSNVKSWWSRAAGTLTTKLDVKTPHIKVNWGTVEAFGKSFNYPKGFSLEWYAKGGILNGAQLFGKLGNTFLGGGEAGREAVLPLETHTEWMDSIAEKVRDGMEIDRDFENDVSGYASFKKALEDFYEEYVRSTVAGMANDMRRQADKREQTVVQIGNKAILDAVVTQQKADGYRFTT